MKATIIQGNIHLVYMILEKVDDQAMVLHEFDHCFLEVVLSMPSFKLHFYSWICRYIKPWWCGGNEQDNIETFHVIHIYLSWFFTFIYDILETLPIQAEVKLVLISVPCTAKYTTYINDVFTLVTSNAKIGEVSQENKVYMIVTEDKMNHVCWFEVWVHGKAHFYLVYWVDELCKILNVWFSPDLKLEKNLNIWEGQGSS